VVVVKKNDAGEADGILAEFRCARALIALNSDVLENATRNGPDALTEAGLSEIIAEPNPVTLNAHFAGRNPSPSGFNFSLPGNLVMYLLLNVLVFSGAAISAERRNGVLRRLAVAPATRLEIIMGKVFGSALLGAAQIVYFLLLGKFAFHINLGANLPGVLLILLLLAWAAAGLGVLAGSCAVAEDKVIPICVLGALVMGALGGCWWPLELAPQTFRTVAMCLPTGWAMAGLNQLISFGSGIGAAVVPMLALLGFGAVANVLAIRFFRV
jgi:ABC-type multidrug transport system permease subunit